MHALSYHCGKCRPFGFEEVPFCSLNLAYITSFKCMALVGFLPLCLRFGLQIKRANLLP